MKIKITLGRDYKHLPILAIELYRKGNHTIITLWNWRFKKSTLSSCGINYPNLSEKLKENAKDMVGEMVDKAISHNELVKIHKDVLMFCDAEKKLIKENNGK